MTEPTPQELTLVERYRLVRRWRDGVVSKAKGRTRYHGQPPFADEAVVIYIDQLEAEDEKLREASAKLALAVGKFIDTQTSDMESYFLCDECGGSGDMPGYVVHMEWCEPGKLDMALRAFNRDVPAVAQLDSGEKAGCDATGEPSSHHFPGAGKEGVKADA